LVQEQRQAELEAAAAESDQLASSAEFLSLDQPEVPIPGSIPLAITDGSVGASAAAGASLGFGMSGPIVSVVPAPLVWTPPVETKDTLSDLDDDELDDVGPAPFVHFFLPPLDLCLM
jgi:hypothetical protein